MKRISAPPVVVVVVDDVVVVVVTGNLGRGTHEQILAFQDKHSRETCWGCVCVVL
jgi:hypothetical protein